MAMYCKIGAMLVLLFLYSSQSTSATANNVKCKGCVGSKDLAKNAVTGSRIKNNAVTGSKIKADAVSMDKLGSDVDAILDDVGDNFSLINDNDQRITNLENSNAVGVVEVGPSSGANYPDPLMAMADLATWCGTPSAANPCLMKILPGVYDLGATPLTMTPYVDIVGSGENFTRLTGTDQIAFSIGTVVGASNSRLSNLTVENKGGSVTSHGIFINATVTSNFVVEHVTVTVSGGSGSNRGVFASGGFGMFDHVTIIVNSSASNYGFNSANGTQTVVNSAIAVSGGTNNSGLLFNNAGSIIMRSSTVSASGTGASGIRAAGNATSGSATVQFSVIESDFAAVSMRFAFTLSASNSQLIGNRMTDIGTRTCVFVTDGSLSALDAACR